MEKILKKEKIKLYNIMINNIEKKFISDSNIISKLDDNKTETVVNNNMAITLIKYDIQKDIESNMVNIDLGKCWDALKNEHNKKTNKNNNKFYLEKIEVNIDGYEIPIIGFNIYAKINENNLYKLNLSVCFNENIDLYIPINLTENLDEVNLSSGYFNDICYSASSDKGTDIIRKDRIKNFIEKNKTKCQNDCVFSEYIEQFKKAKCTCNVKKLMSSFKDFNINKTKFYENYINIKNIMNINILICYKVLFSKKGIKYNYACYSISVIIIFHFLSIILFCARNMFNQNIKDIKNISYALKNWRLLIRTKKLKNVNTIKQRQNKPFVNKNNKLGIKNKNDMKKRNKNFIPNLSISNKYLANKNKLKSNAKKNVGKENNSSLKTVNINKMIKSKSIINKVKNIMEYNFEELNNLSYNIALQKDKRTYCQYYISLLKAKHFFIFTFCYNKDYNIKLIKVLFFNFCFSFDFLINLLFFNDSSIHKIYEDEGIFDLIYQLPHILYSSLISSVIKRLIKFLSLSGEAIIRYKALKNKINNKKNNCNILNNKERELIRKLKIKFGLYFFLSTLLLLCFWYYISMFCAIYKNTQFHLIKNILISYGISFLYPFCLYLLPGIFRIPALANIKSKKKCMYNFSVFLQNIV